MKILATCLLGPGAEATAPDALRSVADAVDGYVLIESGGGGAALRAAYETVTKPATTHHYDWIGDYGHARNFALDTARALGATHALTIDPDERLLNADLLRAEVERLPDLDVFVCRDRDERYFKERVIRCAAPVHWHGRVCEFLDGQVKPHGRTPVEFWELPKSPESERRRWERGVVECKRMIDEGDDCFRWRRHMGTCLAGLGRREEAIEQYEKAHELAEADEDAAWVWYLLCEQKVLDGEYVRAMEDAARGLVDHAGFLPEFAWIIAYCQLTVGNNQNALRWAQIGVQCPDDRTRVSFRSHNARRGCKDILASLLKAPRSGLPPDFEGKDFEERSAEFRENYRRLAVALVETLAPEKHLDLGAGSGLLVEAMRLAGVASHGIEREWSARAAAPELIRDHHMTFGRGVDSWRCAGPVDLVSSVEVLEHLPEADADKAIAAICDQAIRWVYFSAAAPGQAGKGHVNCQPKKYWRAKFEAQGFRFAEAETAALVERIKDLQPCWWLPRNAMIFERSPS